MTSRLDVVREALTWELTPYHHRARIKGVGVDCANLPAAVYEAVGLIPNVDPEYSRQWMFHKDEEQFLSYITPYAQEIERDQVGPGDLIVWKFGRVYSHSAIVLNYPEIIHALARTKLVVRGNADKDPEFIDRPVRYFTLWSS